MTTQPSFVKLVTQALFGADRPLTLAEIKARVEMVRPVRTRDPNATIRGAISSIPLATTLGGRPARYTWWPILPLSCRIWQSGRSNRVRTADKDAAAPHRETIQ